MIFKRIIAIIPILTLLSTIVASCQACSNDIPILDSNIATRLNLYDEFENSKIMQEYYVNDSHQIKFQIGSNFNADYETHNYQNLNFDNISFKDLFYKDIRKRVFEPAKKFVTDVLKIKLFQDEFLPTSSLLEWFDGTQTYPRFVIKTLQYQPNIDSIKQKFEYNCDGYEAFKFVMPPNNAIIGIFDQTNWETKLIAKFQIKTADNALFIKNKASPIIKDRDITFTNDIYSQDYIDISKFNESVSFKVHITNCALETKNFALMLNQKITFKICQIIDNHIKIFPEHCGKFKKTGVYNLAFFIGKVFINADIKLGSL